LQGPGKSSNLLGSDVHGSFRFQTDMFMQMKIAIIIATWYVFWTAGMPKMLSRPGFLSRPRWQSLQHSPRLLMCYLLLYLNVAVFKRCWLTTGSWKNASGGLESPGKVLELCVTKIVGTLHKSHAYLHHLMILLKGLLAILKGVWHLIPRWTSCGIGVGCMTSPIASSAQFCSTKFGFSFLDIHVVLLQICSQNFFRRLDLGVAAISGALLELIFMCNNTSLSLGLDLDVVCSFIHSLCTSRTIP